MPLRPPTLRDLDPLLAELRLRVPELQGVWLFGSLARGSVRADSDIDLALLARAPLDVVRVFDLGLDLGVIASRDVDLVDLRRVSVLLRHIVCTEGRLLVVVDADACDAFVATTAAMPVEPWLCPAHDSHLADRLNPRQDSAPCSASASRPSSIASNG